MTWTGQTGLGARFVLAVIFAAGLSGWGPTRADQGRGEGGRHRAHPCKHVPDSHGRVNGIKRRCGGGSSSGIAKGDFNGDGVADLAVGIPGKDPSFRSLFGVLTPIADAGAVQIIYGTAADGLTATAVAGVPGPQLITELSPFTLIPFPGSPDMKAEAGDQFGAALAAGDFNNDGFSDLAVGIPGEKTNTTAVGAVAVFMGTATGLSPAIARFFGPNTFVPVANPGNSHGAASLTWGDFNHDGFGDLAVASDFTTDFVTQRAAVTVLFGSAAGLTTTGKLQPVVEEVGLNQHAEMPLVLSAGDFNHDGFFDLVAGAPLFDFANNALFAVGNVHVLPGSASGPSLADQIVFDEFVTGVPSNPESNEQFGSALAAGDFNGDGFDDLAIGVPFEGGTPPALGHGAVIVIPGSFFGLQAAGTPGAQILAANGLQFGAALAAGDFDGDGIKDLAIGAPTTAFSLFINGTSQPAQQISAGLVEVIFGTSSGLSRTLGRASQLFAQAPPSGVVGMPPNITTLGGRTESGDLFGAALTAWNFGRSGRADLAIAVPFESIGTAAGAGAVHVIYGSTNVGLTANGAQLWTENTPGLNNTAVAGDHFGLTVY